MPMPRPYQNQAGDKGNQACDDCIVAQDIQQRMAEELRKHAWEWLVRRLGEPLKAALAGR